MSDDPSHSTAWFVPVARPVARQLLPALPRLHLFHHIPSSFLPRLAEQVWQADSFSFQCIKGTFLLWQPALFCHLLAGASHYSGQPLRLDRPLSLPIILSVDPALPPLSTQTHFPTSAIIFFDKPSISFNFKALSTDTHCYSSVPFYGGSRREYDTRHSDYPTM